MNEGPEDNDEAQRPRPKVVDKRISARGEGAQGSDATEPAAPPAESAATSSAAPPPADTTPPEPVRDREARPGPSEVWTPEQEAEAMRIAREIAQTPSIEWVVNTAATLANVAQTKIELGAAADAQLAIDALRALLEGLGPKLQAAEAPLRQTLAQLQLGYADAVASRAGRAVPQG